MNNGTASNIGANLIIAAFGTAALASLSYETEAAIMPGTVVDYHELEINNSWNSSITLSEVKQNAKFSTLKSFSEQLLNNTKDIEPEILEVVNKNFWDLL